MWYLKYNFGGSRVIQSKWSKEHVLKNFEALRFSLALGPAPFWEATSFQMHRFPSSLGKLDSFVRMTMRDQCCVAIVARMNVLAD